MKHHYHLIINSNAGSGNGAKIGKQLIDILENRKEEFTTYFTKYAGNEVEIIHEIAPTKLMEWHEGLQVETFPLLVVLGGDGTLHQVLNALENYSTKIPVAYVPSGSGNDFARGVGISRTTKEAFLQILETDSPQEINMIDFDERVSNHHGLVINNLGIGIDASIVAATNDSATKKTLNKYKLGSLAYVLSVLKVIFTQKGFPVLIEVNGKEYSFKKAFLCTTTNHPYFGGGVPVAPGADPRKDSLDLVLIERLNIFILFYLLIQIFRKKHLNSRFVYHFESNKLRLISTTPQFAQTDGETIDKQPYDLYFTTNKRYIWFK
ncbi:MAG: diacylglycerol kinase family lipid kinase [Lactobacillales bacterium]|nr:diacylglycerol kinase family lipid kinase [Lactobacillales bacterium]